MSALHASNVDAPQSASVEVLTAEVRVLAVGNRQVTLSVYKQLDKVPVDDLEPWGRVRGGMQPRGFPTGIELIGRSKNGELARAYVYKPEPIDVLTLDLYGDFGDWFRVGARQEWVRWHDHKEDYEDLPRPIKSIHILTKGSLSAVYPVPGKPGDFTVDPELPPGAIEWANAEAQTNLLAAAEEEIADVEAERDRYQRLSDLPLIVLAGLK